MNPRLRYSISYRLPGGNARWAFALAALAFLATEGQAAPAQPPDAAKAVAAECAALEKRLPEFVRVRLEMPSQDGSYAWDTPGGQVNKTAYFDESGTAVKVVTVHEDKRGSFRTEVLLKDGQPIFLVEGIYETLPDKLVHANENRLWFQSGRCVRWESCAGDVKRGPDGKANTGTLKRFEEGAAKRDAQSTERYENAVETAQLDGGQLRDIYDPPLEGVPYRLVGGTASPDGRYQVGWGLRTRVARVLRQFATTGDDGGSKVENYLIDLKTKKILCKIPGEFGSDDPSQNSGSLTAVWSPDGRSVFVYQNWKWNTAEASLILIDPVGKPAAPIDVLNQADEWVAVFLKDSDSPYFDKLDRMSFTIAGAKLDGDGQLTFQYIGQIPRSDEDGSFVTLEIAARIRPAAEDVPAGLDLTGIRVAKDP